MRVVCINDKDQWTDDPNMPLVKKGNIYNVLGETYQKEEADGKYRFISGLYYEFVETGAGNGYHESMFIPINEDQQEETEMERNYNKETA